MMKKTYLFSLFLILTLILTGCHRRKTWAEPGHIEKHMFTRSIPIEDIRASIIDVLNRGNHIIDKEIEQTFFVTMTIRQNKFLHLRIPYTENGFEIQYVASEGFEVAQTKDNEIVINARYIRYMQKLRKNIQRNLNRRRSTWWPRKHKQQRRMEVIIETH